MDVAVVGAGAMGSLFGGLLAAAGKRPSGANAATSPRSRDAGEDATVTLVNRGPEHVDAINERGLVIVDDTGEADGSNGTGGASPTETVVDVAATTSPGAVGTVDLLVLFVKSYQTATAMADAAPLVGPETAVLTLQNGLGNAETIAERVPEGRVLAGVTTHGAVREAPGRVRHTGTGETAFGRYFDREGAADDGVGDDRLRAIADRFTAAGIPTGIVDDAPGLLWEKVLVNVGVNAPTALARVENGRLVDAEPGRRLVERAVAEAADVARANGHDIREDIVEYAFTVAERTARNRSSMHQDVAAGRRTEVEALYGAVVERGASVGSAVPVTRTLADLVRLAEEGD